ncbi:MAG: class I SAM-dependent methyltransferase [Solirubrobacterales bacterium]
MPQLVYVRLMRLLYLVWLDVPPARPLADKAMQRIFGRLAEDWDSLTSSAARWPILETALAHLATPPTRVLDMGCGTGTATIALAERYPGAWVEGIDASPEMIDLATRKASQAGAAVRFKQGKAQATGLDDGTFDLVVLINVPPPFREIWRLLKPGGQAIVIFTAGQSTPFYSRPARLDSGFRRAGLTVTNAAKSGPGELTIAERR